MSMSDFAAFVGRSRTGSDTVEPWRVEALAAALDLDLPARPGDALPLPFHFMLFREAVGRGATGVDGHSRRGGFLPPVELPRRMFAGARMDQLRPIVIGEEVMRSERIAAVESKVGASGALVVVRLAFEYRQCGALCLSEERDIIYREGGGKVPPSGALVAVGDAAWSRDWEIDPVLLFRFSALTFNGHRIHYDTRYAREEEGYPDLVVHGPLVATLLCRLAEQGAGRPPKRFSFRAMRPFLLGGAVRLRGGPDEGGRATLRALTPAGEIGMQAEAEFE